MSETIKKTASSLEEGKIPDQLSFLKNFGKELRENPKKYQELRKAVLEADTDNEKIAIMKGFAISEEGLRKLVPTELNQPMIGTITITITITITLTPGTAH